MSWLSKAFKRATGIKLSTVTSVGLSLIPGVGPALAAANTFLNTPSGQSLIGNDDSRTKNNLLGDLGAAAASLVGGQALGGIASGISAQGLSATARGFFTNLTSGSIGAMSTSAQALLSASGFVTNNPTLMAAGQAVGSLGSMMGGLGLTGGTAGAGETGGGGGGFWSSLGLGDASDIMNLVAGGMEAYGAYQQGKAAAEAGKMNAGLVRESTLAKAKEMGRNIQTQFDEIKTQEEGILTLEETIQTSREGLDTIRGNIQTRRESVITAGEQLMSQEDVIRTAEDNAATQRAMIDVAHRKVLDANAELLILRGKRETAAEAIGIAHDRVNTAVGAYLTEQDKYRMTVQEGVKRIGQGVARAGGAGVKLSGSMGDILAESQRDAETSANIQQRNVEAAQRAVGEGMFQAGVAVREYEAAEAGEQVGQRGILNALLGVQVAEREAAAAERAVLDERRAYAAGQRAFGAMERDVTAGERELWAAERGLRADERMVLQRQRDLAGMQRQVDYIREDIKSTVKLGEMQAQIYERGGQAASTAGLIAAGSAVASTIGRQIAQGGG